jgi:hypothetical protein
MELIKQSGLSWTKREPRSKLCECLESYCRARRKFCRLLLYAVGSENHRGAICVTGDKTALSN